VLALLLGTFALAIPAVTRVVDGWLFSEWDEERPKWSSQGSTEDKNNEGQDQTPPAATQPQRLQNAASDLRPLEMPVANPSAPASLAFDFQEETSQLSGEQVRPAVMRTEHVAEIPQPTTDVRSLQQAFQDLGADYVVVEAVEGTGAFECRCLMPLAPQSSYQKAFSAVGSRPEVAMQQVLAEVQTWKRVGPGERLYRN
jgi:hypothetical protein